MKEGLTIYKNGVEARFQDRRIAMTKASNAVYIEFTRINHSKRWRPVRMKRLKGCKVVTAIALSNEAMEYLFNCYYHLKIKNKEDENKTK